MKINSIFFVCSLCLSALLISSCQKELQESLSTPIALINPSFEDSLTGWTVETDYIGAYGFTSSSDAAKTGSYGLNFYVSQAGHFPGARQETPWDGKIYQTVTGLKDGWYSMRVHADAVGHGMYLWANGGKQDQKVKILSEVSESNSLDFEVYGGTAKIGFICIAAGGEALFAPYFHADDVELYIK